MRREKEMGRKRRGKRGSREGRLWCGLRKAWKGYKIAKARGDRRAMKQYAKAIENFRKKLGLKGRPIKI